MSHVVVFMMRPCAPDVTHVRDGSWDVDVQCGPLSRPVNGSIPDDDQHTELHKYLSTITVPINRIIIRSTGGTFLDDLQFITAPEPTRAPIREVVVTGYNLKITDLRPLMCLTSMTSLSLTGLSRLSDIKPLAACVDLKTLKINAAGRTLTDLSPLSSLTSLHTLSLFGCWTDDVAPLAACTSLVDLDLECCSGVTRVADLTTCIMLGKLNIRLCHVSDVDILVQALPLLRVVS